MRVEFNYFDCYFYIIEIDKNNFRTYVKKELRIILN